MWEDRETFSPPAHLNYQYHFEDTPREAAKAQRFSCLSPLEAYFLQSAKLRPIFSPVENYGHMRSDGVLDCCWRMTTRTPRRQLSVKPPERLRSAAPNKAAKLPSR